MRIVGDWVWPWVFLLACVFPSEAARAQACAPWAAKVVSVQGRVEVDRGAQARVVGLDEVLCPGDRIRVGERARAAIRLADEDQTVLRLDQLTTLSFAAREPDRPSWLDLLRGAIHFITRIPQRLEIRTPFVNASVEGTEFVLRVLAAETRLWVFEGRVRVSNPRGELQIGSGAGALARAGQAPVGRLLARPREAVEWALYYPPLIDPRPEGYPEALRGALSAYRGQGIERAFAELKRVPAAARDARFFLLRAGLLLGVGRVREAERALAEAGRRDPEAGGVPALAAIIALTRDQKDEALRLAEAGVALEPGSPLPEAALSYAHQGRYQLPEALAHARRAVDLAPDDALLWARISELELSRGALDEALAAAERALALDPALSRTQTVLGFAHLIRIEVDAARAAFERAIAADPSDPLPRLGMGLARIREGEVDAGTREIETAASLDPNDSLIRSYLGKAYFEQRRAGLASTEFEQGKRLDPKDPTPWFYDAIHKQTMNRPVEALHDLEHAIALNDNRAIYRSKLLLDEDLAARSAAVARIYRDLGFERRALLEGWRSVNTDPADYSGHRLLADAYSALPRHGLARVSELLQSQLRQPANLTPVQPQLAERDLLILDGSGPPVAAFNEFNSLFLRNRLALQATARAGSNETYGEEVTQSGVWDRVSYSLGQFHYSTDGFRPNNDLSQDIYDAFVQVRASPFMSLQAEARHREIDHGDIRFDFDLDDFDSQARRRLMSDSVRFGAHYYPAPHSDFIASFQYRGQELEDAPFLSRTSDGLIGESQYLLRLPAFKLIAGAGYYDVKHNPDLGQSFHVRHGNGYAYSYLRYPAQVTWTLGASVDALQTGDPETHKEHYNRLNPKFGLLWDLSPDTTLRAAVFKTLKRATLFDQTIEPTQVAGFNQFFDDFDSTEARRLGIGLDHRFSSKVYGGVEVSRRDLKTPIDTLDGTVITRFSENNRRAYLYWTPHARLAVSASVESEEFEPEIEEIPAVETLFAPATVSYFDPGGFFASLNATLVDQEVERQGEDQFVLFNGGLGYRLPHRYGIASAGINNILDQDFSFRGLTVHRSPPREGDESPLFTPERTFFLQMTLAF
jgi:tetratricopeptide (TPR) repeat protein